MIRWWRPVALMLFAGLPACRDGAIGSVDGGETDGERLYDALPPLDGATAGYALSFDGADDYATAANGGFMPVGYAFTIEVWVDFPSATADQDFIVLRTDLDSGVRVGTHAGNIAVRRVYVDRVIAEAPSLPTLNRWHHVAYTFDLTTNRLYVDGTEVDAQAVPTDTRTPTSAWLGSIDGSNNLYRGLMDEVRVWTVTRTAADIQADMHHRAAGSEPGLVAYWTFDDAQPGGLSGDASGSGNDVTLGDGFLERMPARVPSDAPAN
jgi:hypothetical protein